VLAEKRRRWRKGWCGTARARRKELGFARSGVALKRGRGSGDGGSELTGPTLSRRRSFPKEGRKDEDGMDRKKKEDDVYLFGAKESGQVDLG
jgi:hypothetical protein